MRNKRTNESPRRSTTFANAALTQIASNQASRDAKNSEYGTVPLRKHVETVLGGSERPKSLNKLNDTFIDLAAAKNYLPVVQELGANITQGASPVRLKLLTRAAGSVLAGFAITNGSLNQGKMLERIRIHTSDASKFDEQEEQIRTWLHFGWKRPWRRLSIKQEANISKGGHPGHSVDIMIGRTRTLLQVLTSEVLDFDEVCDLSSSVYQWGNYRRRKRAEHASTT